MAELETDATATVSGVVSGTLPYMSPELRGFILDPGRSRADLIAKYFNTAAFASPTVGSFGNSGRNILTGPGNFTINMALLKNFRLSSRESLGKFQFRAETYNLLNWVNLGNPANSLTSPNFGKISSAGAARVMQFALRYDF